MDRRVVVLMMAAGLLFALVVTAVPGLWRRQARRDAAGSGSDAG
jgi:UDP-GlcNAc:undecaprenyl-phosphate GlcNAc-1-phosphate transferase